MDYKLIALDLDYTLLNDDKSISAQNRQALERAHEAGIHIVIATGRSPGASAAVRKQLGIYDYTIMTGGAQILDPDFKDAYTCCLPMPDGRDIMNYLVKNDIYFQAYLDDNEFYYLKRTPYTDINEHNCGYTGIMTDSFLHIPEPKITKLLAITHDGQEDNLHARLSARFPQLGFIVSQVGYVEVLNKSVSKGSALLKLAEMLDIPREQTIAVGDSVIDMDMLQNAGLGAAVANAREDVKAAADYVSKADSNHSGVAEIVNKFIFKEG